ncbi:MAG: EthD family reductase [Solirubrobacterales bacterium]
MAYTILFAVERKEGLSDEEFVATWLEHSKVGAALPNLRGYEILTVDESAETGGKPADGFVIMRFDSKEDWEAAAASPEMATSVADSPSFAAHFSTYFVESHTII